MDSHLHYRKKFFACAIKFLNCPVPLSRSTPSFCAGAQKRRGMSRAGGARIFLPNRQNTKVFCHPERQSKAVVRPRGSKVWQRHGTVKTKNHHNGGFIFWHSQWESNPCCRNENPMSWTARRWGQLQNHHRIPDVFQNVNSVQIFFHTIRGIFPLPHHTGHQTHICPNRAAYT